MIQSWGSVHLGYKEQDAVRGSGSGGRAQSAKPGRALLKAALQCWGWQRCVLVGARTHCAHVHSVPWCHRWVRTVAAIHSSTSATTECVVLGH